MKTFAIITAAGSGSRFLTGKKSIPKQYVRLNGKPVILYSLQAFQKIKLIDEILVSANRRYFDLIHSLAVKNKITKLTTLVEGGKTRFMSVKNAFLQTRGKPGDLVLIHDAARPNINKKLIEMLLTNALKYGEVIPGVKISETVKKESKGIIKGTVDRSNLWTVQTPQVFRYKILKKSYRKAGRKIDFTDEAALVENAGYRVRIIEGEKDNIKITSRDEIIMLKKIMKTS
jgi:2-C-methyl-D-erythritol 4-phosphate cytidylyltransferase